MDSKFIEIGLAFEKLDGFIWVRPQMSDPQMS
jgi:hypothetical protein